MRLISDEEVLEEINRIQLKAWGRRLERPRLIIRPLTLTIMVIAGLLGWGLVFYLAGKYFG